MRVACIGGGPAGLYFAILAKRADPARRVTVFERNRPGDTFGWGVVFSDATLDAFARADPETHAAITGDFFHWDEIDVFFRGRRISSGGHGFAGIARRRLLELLEQRALALGVEVRHGQAISAAALAGAHDLVVAADGVHSETRAQHAATFVPRIERGRCRYLWLGSDRRLDAFTFDFRETEWGWFQLHAYRFSAHESTFIVETRAETWRAAGLDHMAADETVALCERLFAERLAGHRLRVNPGHRRGSEWLEFATVSCERWFHDHVVLVGDAAHTAHFSIGSGTKLAMEDAIVLAEEIDGAGTMADRLGRYEQRRRLEALRLQNAARNRMEWFENVERYVGLPPEQFAYALLTGSQRISHENLRRRDRGYVAGVESWFAARAGVGEQPIPPMFTPFSLRGLTVPNRVVVSPMAMYSAVDGIASDFHLVHLGARALGGAGLVFTEMTCVAPDARISPGCAGLWSEAHERAWARIVAWIHAATPAKIALQLGHAGPKGSTQLGWEQPDEPLLADNWPLIAPSAVAYGPSNQIPRAMDRADMDRVRDQFVRAAEMGARAGFDLLELHCAHGYLLSSFICPLTNRRTDAHGGDLAARCRFPLEVFAAMREVWPAERPMAVRISAHDWAPGGNTPDDAVEIARSFAAVGADLVDVSSGQTTREARPVYGRMYQTPFADRIRNEIGIATMAVGNIFEPDHVNGIVAAGRADLCALARPHLADPAWTLHAAAALGHGEIPWPPQYSSGKAQLERNLARARAEEPTP